MPWVYLYGLGEIRDGLIILTFLLIGIPAIVVDLCVFFCLLSGCTSNENSKYKKYFKDDPKK
jgi:hypothetical protein